MNSRLIIIRGIPGSGKSYIAKALQNALGTENVVMLDPDAIDSSGDAFINYSSRLTAEGIDEKFHAFRFLRQTGYDGITAGKTVIWNQAFNDFNGLEITIRRMQEFADVHSVSLSVLVVEVEIDHELAAARVRQRVAGGGHDVTPEKLAAFVRDYESFAGRGYDTVSINGAEEASKSMLKILSALNI